MNEERSVNKSVINWLACIYAVHHLNPYNMGIFKSRDLAIFNKNVIKIIKNKVKYTHF